MFEERVPRSQIGALPLPVETGGWSVLPCVSGNMTREARAASIRGEYFPHAANPSITPPEGALDEDAPVVGDAQGVLDNWEDVRAWARANNLNAEDVRRMWEEGMFREMGSGGG